MSSNDALDSSVTPGEAFSSYKKEVPFDQVPPNLLSNWQMASWLGSGDMTRAQLSSNGVLGVTKEELKNVEALSSRITTGDGDPPIYLLYEKVKDSGIAKFKIQRYSQTLDDWEDLLEVSGDIRENTLSIKTKQESTKTMAIASPILEKVNNSRQAVAESICQKSGLPNKLLTRTYFATNPSDAYWLQLDSPVAAQEHETDSQPHYRLYVNPKVSDVDKYGEIAGKVVSAARDYKDKGLSFKLMYGGEGAKKVILDPKSTKIVFYFNKKSDAINFGDYLEKVATDNPILNSVEPQAGYQDSHVPQKIWKNGLIILGRGFREVRADVKEKLNNQTLAPLERERLTSIAKNLSIRI
jgi:hypothetical protein